MKQEIQRVIKLPSEGYGVFVGDTHGDLEATKWVIENYSKPNYLIIFLGDYVDLGPDSKENIKYILNAKERNKNIITLLGNHELFEYTLNLSPARFWWSLNEIEKKEYFAIFRKFPLVVYSKDIIALHGALPKIDKLKDIENLDLDISTKLDSNKSQNEVTRQIVWGDFLDRDIFYSPSRDINYGRPGFGKKHFDNMMKKFEKNVLIRGHDPTAPQSMYDNQCLTLFTSKAYDTPRRIAIVDLSKEIRTINDLEILQLE